MNYSNLEEERFEVNFFTFLLDSCMDKYLLWERRFEFEFDSSTSFDKFEEFVSKHKIFIAKPNDLSCGKGISKVDTRY